MLSFRLSSLKLPVTSSLEDQNQVSHKPMIDSSPLQKLKSNPNSRSVPAAVIRLSKAELVQEMQMRGLPETGTGNDLRERLLEAIKDEQHLITGALHLLKLLLTSAMPLHKLKYL